MYSVRDLIEARAAERPDRVYLVFEDREFTFAEMDLRSRQVAQGLADRGLKKGDRVAVLLENCPDFLHLWWGILRLGAVMVPVNLRLTASEAAYIVDHSGSRALVVGPAAAHLLEPLRGRCRAVEHWLSLGGGPADALESFYSLAGDPERPPIEADDDAVILYTSGTTGFPKGVVHTHGNYRITAESFVRTAELKSSDRLLTANPLFHVNAQFYSCIGTLTAGSVFILAPRFSASRMWDWTRRHRANKVVMLLALTTILYQRPAAADDADNPVEIVVAGGAPAGCYHAFEERFGVRLQTIYSLTEAPLSLMSPPGMRCVDGAVGCAMVTPDGVENRVLIVDEENREAPPGTAGEIVLRNPALMKAYLRDPEATAAAMAGGWLHTGDRGLRDEKGWIHFLGRAKDVIRKKGENIGAAEVEGVLAGHSAVAEAAVVGVRPADAAGEEEVMAFVVAAEGRRLSWPDLIAHCEANLADFKVPRFWRALEALPKTATNRVVKARLGAEGPPEAAAGTFDRASKREG